MGAPQGTAYWGGINDFISASFTFTPGISPSVCRIVIPPQSVSNLQAGGDLTWRYGGSRIVFRDCRLDSVMASGGANRTESWTLYIQDRRWLWRETGRISGFYNVQTTGGLKKDSEKSPRELAKLCLNAMGEKKFSLAGLPNDTRPEIDWDYANPAEALASLCDWLGCSVVLGLDNRVYIVRNGQGRKLPRQNIIDGAEVLDPPDPPGKIVVVGGRTRYQHDFKLEAVGLDADGEIRPINDLTYIKEMNNGGNWLETADVPDFNGLKNARIRGLARLSVFRWYRIKTPFRLPGVTQPINDLRRILPLDDTQLERSKKDPKKNERKESASEPLPPWVFGVFCKGGESLKSSTEKIEHNIKKNPEGLYTGEFEIDAETGIVRFNEPVCKIKKDDKNSKQPAELVLRIACNLRDEKTRGWAREEFSGGAKVRSRHRSKKKYLLREDIAREIYARFHPKPVKTVDNLDAVTKTARCYLEAELAKYATRRAGTVIYAGLVPISPDGVTKQVTFTVGGNGRASTRISRNREEPHLAPTYAEKRINEQSFAELRQARKTAAQRARDARKGGAK